ncbi:MAG: hypothetical protein K8S00_13050 [Bacteroidales bacterium]|nr:hypothetical protein [Bacteroidales bacterium]
MSDCDKHKINSNNRKYFGIKFKEDFPLDDKGCRDLAEILLINPNIVE